MEDYINQTYLYNNINVKAPLELLVLYSWSQAVSTFYCNLIEL